MDIFGIMNRMYIGILLTLCISRVCAQIVYEDVALEYGILHAYINPTTGGGVSFFDFDRDGLDDITLATESGRQLAFYLNKGDHFELIDALVDNVEAAKQILWVDYDNDGDSDLYVAAFEGHNRMYENNGNLEFTEITEACGFPIDRHRGYGACWGDYNRDGWLDLYFNSRKIPDTEDQINTNRLFKNNADRTFTEVTDFANAAAANKTPFCSSFIDYNNDKWPDLYTAQDKQMGNTLLRNQKDGTFLDVSSATNTGFEMNAMCVAPADINHDGWTDIYVANTPEGNICLLNNGPVGIEGEVTFEEVSELLGITFNGIGWGSHFFDADNDGDLDLYVSGAITGTTSVSSLFYENVGGLKFEALDPINMKGDTAASFSNAIGDLNSDGLTDIVVQNNVPFKFDVWKNQTNNENNWVKIKLEGVLSNRDGIGARIESYSLDLYNSSYATCGIGFLGQNSSLIHFGLGSQSVVDSLIVTWPTGHIDKFYAVSANQVFFVKEGQSTNGEISIDPDIDIITSIVAQPVAKESQLLDKLVIYPNPGSSTIDILNKQDGLYNADILIRSADGKESIRILDHPLDQTIDIESLKPGIYFLEVRVDQIRRLIKFVKI
jgi:ASPIC and UnbV/FG-GAP-like repeat/Secretion system C-terminal sorting domain